MVSSHFTEEKEAEDSALSLKDYGDGLLGCGGLHSHQLFATWGNHKCCLLC
jgi:hypothetical protein